MKPSTRFSILPFPQHFNGSVLELNIVFLPRNQNPLRAAAEPSTPAGAPAFADATLSFEARIISDLSDLPLTTAANPTPLALTTSPPTQAHVLFDALGQSFKIIDPGAQNTDPYVGGRAPAPVPPEDSVKKYLPLTYRQAFNFVAPRTKNAVTNDAYFCAVRDAKPAPKITSSTDDIRWGQVFAYAMRQPLLAEALGMIYRTELVIDAAYFPKGGWLYVDLAATSDYQAQQAADPEFARRYAARIPALTVGKERPVFAPILFPVAGSTLPGNYDELFIEAADYDDGFCKVTHGFQPVSDNLLVETSDGSHPTKEIGIRLGWDDEQILVWYMRQLSEDASTPGQRIEVPLGVAGYRIDVREHAAVAASWQSLNLVSSSESLKLKGTSIGDFTARELNYQVFPTRIDGDPTKPCWLPMYFAAWSGKSMVLPDDDAARIYQHQKADVRSGINVTGPPANQLNKTYVPAPIDTELRYGKLYDFRVRLGDLSGGGPDAEREPVHESTGQVATVHFKRYVAPSALRIADLPANSDDVAFAPAAVSIQRPLLGYPAVVFTGQYTDPIGLLEQASLDATGVGGSHQAFGIPDPDVDAVEITVEIQTLQMDNLLSISGKEPYIKLYTTTRPFPTTSPSFDDVLNVPITYADCKVLEFGDPDNLGDLGFSQTQIDGMGNLVLPTARTVRLTLRALCIKRTGYYGLEQSDPAFNTRYGRTTEVRLYKPSSDERELFLNSSPARTLQGVYLQPDPPVIVDGTLTSVLIGKEVEKAPDMIQRLAQQLGLESRGLTLVAKKGERVQFGCSQRIRHTLSPENASITFASKGDLMHHWLCCVTLDLRRDWTWDAVQDRSFVVTRVRRFREDAETEQLEVGDIEMKRTVPFDALIGPDRGHTRLIFIDAVEAKNERMQTAPHDKEPRFPDLIEVDYSIQTVFKNGHATQHDGDSSLSLELPITTPPAQTPKIVSAGLALSQYVRNERYSSTEPRRRFLWVEFDEPIRDAKDTYFARVLAYAPDQLISNNDPGLLPAPDEPALPIDPEYIRVVTPGQSNDDAGLDAMQPMEKATDSDRHYLLPLPPNLHAESAEMFGFFTYEFRVGHHRYGDTSPNHESGDSVWTTAQGRFGRALRSTGVQHPAPTLTCVVNRDEEKLYVTAPYALAVHAGKNVTADPPRTEIWSLLYAQVKQADNRDHRNILLDDKVLDWRIRVEHRKEVRGLRHRGDQQAVLKRALVRNWKESSDIGAIANVVTIADTGGINVDATKVGTVIWTSSEVEQLLDRYGLPLDSPLSVLCVEMLPQITSIHDHVRRLDDEQMQTKWRSALAGKQFDDAAHLLKIATRGWERVESADLETARPLSDDLGHYRILRTSPLVEVPFVC